MRPSGPESIQLPYVEKSAGIGSEPRAFYKPGDACEVWMGNEELGCFYRAVVVEHAIGNLIHVEFTDDRLDAPMWKPGDRKLFMTDADNLRSAVTVEEGIRN